MADDILLRIKVDTTELDASYKRALVEGEKLEAQTLKIGESEVKSNILRNAQLNVLLKTRKNEVGALEQMIQLQSSLGQVAQKGLERDIKGSQQIIKGIDLEIARMKTLTKGKEVNVQAIQKQSRATIELSKQSQRLTTRLRRVGTAALFAFGVAALAAVVKYGKAIINLFDATKALTAARSKAVEIAAKEKTKLDVLLKVAKSEVQTKERREQAIRQINKISPEMLGNITLENIETQKTTESTEKYNAALDIKAKKQALFGLILAATIKIEKAQVELDNTRTQSALELITSSITGTFLVDVGQRKILKGTIKQAEAEKALLLVRLLAIGGIDDEDKAVKKLTKTKDKEAELAKIIAEAEEDNILSLIHSLDDLNSSFEFDNIRAALRLLDPFITDLSETKEEAEKASDALEDMFSIEKRADIIATANGFDDFRDAFLNMSDRMLEKFPEITEAFNEWTEGINTNAQTIRDYGQTLGSLGDIFTSLGKIVGEETVRAAGLQKVAALFNIAAALAVSIANVVQMASEIGKKGGPIAFVSTLVGGLATVIAVIASARQAFKETQVPAQTFEEGTEDAPGGLAWVGEKGKELMYVPKHAQIFTNQASKHKDDIEALNSGKWEEYLTKAYIYPAIVAAQARQKKDDDSKLESIVKAYFDGGFDDNRLHKDNREHKEILLGIYKRLKPKDIPASRSRYG